MAINILEKAVHALKKAVQELEGQAGNAHKIREIARNLEPELEPVAEVVMKLNGEVISLGRIPEKLRDLAEADEHQFNRFINELKGQ